MTATSITVYHRGVVFTADDAAGTPVEAFAVSGSKFVAAGSIDEVRASVTALAGDQPVTEVDLAGAFVAPGIIDSHSHLVGFGESLSKAQLRDCTTLEEIHTRLREARDANPDAPRILGIGWLFPAVGDTMPTAAMLDEIFPDVPVYLDANDLHSVWVNSAALAEMGITSETPDPIGGEICRDEHGNASGLLLETAGTKYAWAFLASVATPEDTLRALDLAFTSYLEVGVTGATEMSLKIDQVAALRAIVARDGKLPFPVTAHWIHEPTGDTEEDIAAIAQIAKLRDEVAAGPERDWLRVAGVKFIMDGVIDACTATMRAPYVNGTNTEPIWTAERVQPVAEAAVRAGLQLAMHAIGDRTSEIALDTVEHVARVTGIHPERARIEHLESVTDETITRMAKLGVIASMQPVHCDPAVLDNWKAVLGGERQERGFPWHKFRDAQVHITLGTDAPTAPHEPLPNLYIALTGGSVLSPGLDPYHPERAFTPAEALTALTAGGAYAGGMDDTTGRIRAGLDANFIVLDVNPLECAPSDLLNARVLSTYVRGVEAHTA